MGADGCRMSCSIAIVCVGCVCVRAGECRYASTCTACHPATWPSGFRAVSERHVGAPWLRTKICARTFVWLARWFMPVARVRVVHRV